ncbi:hypothetical protein [Zunongwangia sp. H14]|uniref:hypothetical protein n=1 Tax=Zunongwangia sp. H14 TaxID=3240792 RepID=UPI003562148C
MKNIFRIIIAVFVSTSIVSCDKDDDDLGIDLEGMAAPSNLGATFKITQDNTGLVTIIPTGEGANLFSIDFGDGSEVSGEIRPGQAVEHVYDEGDYQVEVTGQNLNGVTASGTQNLTVSFRAPENLVVDVVQSENNPKNITVSATADYATMFNVYFGENEDEEATALMPGETLDYTYLAPGDYDLRVVALSGGAATTEETVVVTVPEAEPAKLPITFDEQNVNYAFSTFNGTSFEVVDNPDFSGANNEASMVGAITNSGAAYEGGAFNLGTPVDFSVENKTITMKMWSDVALPVLLKFEGGVNGERQTEVTANHEGTGWEELSFNFATDAVKSYVDGAGDNGEAFVPTGQYGTMVIFIDGPGTTAGTFYVDDIMKAAPGLPESPVIAAPTPTLPEEAVISLFSDAYTNVAVDTWRTDWSAATLEDVEIDGNATKKYSALNFVGIETVGSQIDASEMTHFHTDIWTNNATVVKVKLVDFGPDGGYQGGDDSEHEITIENPTQGEWVSLDLALEDFEGLTARANISQLIYSATPVGEATVFIDNVYFYDETALGPDEPEAATPTPTADAADVQSIFSDAYPNPSGVNYYPDWGQSTTYEMLSIDGNEAIKYANANYQGIDIGEDIDATAYTTVHIDVWSGDYTSIPFFLISRSGEKPVSISVTPNEWNSVEIPLSEFTDQGLDISDIFQFKFDVQPDNGGTFYIDNLYFHN